MPKAYLKTIVITGGESIESYVFNDCESLMSITIPKSVTRIGAGVFSNCGNLQTIYCEYKENEKPAGWSNDWKKDCFATVIWGYKGK